MGDGVEHNLLALWMVLFAVFAARKFTQPIKVFAYSHFRIYFVRILNILKAMLIVGWIMKKD